MVIFEALRHDHDTQRQLAERLLNSSGDSDERRSIYQRLREELRQHEKAEERYLYAPMLALDLTQEKARHSISEHHEMDEFIEQLDETDMSSSQWLAIYKKLHEKLIHHLDEEEREVFQLAGKAFSQAQKEQLGMDYQLLIKHERKTA